MKKEIKIVAIVLVALIVFLSGFGLGSTKGIKFEINVKNEGGSVQAGNVQTPAPAPTQPAPAPTAPAPTDAPPAPETPATDAPTPDAPATEAPATPDAPATDAPTDAPSGAKAPSTPAEAAETYNKLLKDAKNLQDGSIRKIQEINIECTSCSVGIAKPIVNGLLPSLAKGGDWTNNFAGGKDVESGNPAGGYITPGGRDVNLKPEYVASVTSTPAGDGYHMDIKLISEKSTYDGTNTVNPVAHESCMDPLNLAAIDLGGVAVITKADMTYPGATLGCDVDGQGRLTKLVVDLPLDGSGTGSIEKLGGMSVDVGLAGNLLDTYEITWA